jgi:PKD repeat protein
LTLIDGGTAEVAARVAVAEPGADLRSVQDGTVGYALDRALGIVRRVDPATFVAAPGVEVIEGARGELSAHPSGELMYVVDHTRGRVGVADGGALSSLRGEVQSLAEPVGSSVVDGGGRLWVLGGSTGDLTWFDGPERGGRPGAVDDPADAQLVVVDGTAAVVERGGRLVRSLAGDGRFDGRACLEIDPADASVRVGGSDRAPRLYVVSGDDGVLRVSDLGSGECGAVVVDVAAPGSDLGAPQEARGHVFIPDFSDGTVVVVDLESREVTRTAELVAPGTEFELFDRDGIVFYNDPGSERAGVVRIDGSFAAVRKYDPERPGAGVVPADGTSADDPGTPDAAEAGAGDGVDDGAVGGQDPGGVEPEPEAEEAGGDGGPSPGEVDPAEPDPEGGDPTAEPVPDSGLPSGSATTDPQVPPDPRVPPVPGGPPSPPGTQLSIVASAAGAEVGERLTMRARPVDPDETVTNVTWDFGDGDTATGASAGHAWDSPGLFRVTVAGTLETGARVTAFADFVVVAPPPVPLTADWGFSPAAPVVGEPVGFTDLSTGTPTSWTWQFEGATGSRTSSLRTPPPQVWDAAGQFTVTLTVRRGTEVDTFSRDVTVAPPPAGAPAITDIAILAAEPFDDRTEYIIEANLIDGEVTTCTYTIEGASVACSPEIGHGFTRLRARHTFTAGSHTIGLQVTWPGGPPVNRSLTITVQALTPPQAAISVAGAAPTDGSGTAFTATEGTAVTFDGSRTTGSYERLDWVDLATGETATGGAFGPSMAVGRHTIQLTAVSRAGDDTATVVVDMTPRDTSAPTGTIDAADTYDFTVAARDPESPVTRVAFYGYFTGLCYPSADPTAPGEPVTLDFRTTPFAVASGGELQPAGGGSVTVTRRPPLCPAGHDFGLGPGLGIEAWAVVTNAADLSTETDHFAFYP